MCCNGGFGVMSYAIYQPVVYYAVPVQYVAPIVPQFAPQCCNGGCNGHRHFGCGF